MATMTGAGRLTSVSDFKVIWCFVHVCVGVNKTFYKTCAVSFIIEAKCFQLRISCGTNYKIRKNECNVRDLKEKKKKKNFTGSVRSTVH